MRVEIPTPFGGLIVIETSSADAQSKVEQLYAKFRNRAKLLGTVANAMRADIRRQFSVGGDPAWKPLAPSTIAAKKRAGLPALTAKGNIPWRLKQRGMFTAAIILIATGRLRDSWGLKGHPEHIEVLNQKTGEITMGSSVPYAKYHQSKKPRKRLPRRAVNLTMAGQNAMLVAYRSYLGDLDGETVDK